MSTLLENVDKVVAAHTAIGDALKAKGVSVPEGTKLSGMPPLIEQIQTEPVPTNNRAVFTDDPATSIVAPKMLVVDMSKVTNLRACFNGCSYLTSLTLQDGFGQGGLNFNSCFSGCTALPSLTLPEGFGKVARILNYCFYNCSALAELTLPAEFGQNATDVVACFRGCSSLATLNLPAGFG